MANPDLNDPESFFSHLRANGSDLPMPKLASPMQVRQQAASHSASIFRSFDSLRAIVDRHELTIQNRWMKKTQSQRLKIILSAWPGLALSHRPDYAAFRKKKDNSRSRDTYMWPYMNQEDLVRPRTFLLLLNARARNHPSCFAAADNEAMHLGRATTALVPLFLNEHVVTLNEISDRKADGEYGRLLHWDDHPDAFDWMQKQEQFLPGEALLILEAQERLMSFLFECCTLILHDIPEEMLGSDSYPIKPEPPSKSEKNVIGHASLSVMAQETPYLLPSKPAFSRVASLLSAAAVSAQDHIWSLREDPAYFHETILEEQEHRQEMLMDTFGRKHPILQPQRKDVFWHRVISNVITRPYIMLELWSELSRQAQHLAELQMHHITHNSSNSKPSEEYLYSLLKFRYYLLQAVKGPLGSLKMNVVASMPFRPFFVREPPPNSTTPKIVVVPTGRKMEAVESQVLFLLQALWEDGRNLFLLRLPPVVDELQRLIDKEQPAKNMITGLINNLIGDLAILCECLKQVENYQPWALSFENLMLEKGDEIKQEYAKSASPWAGMLGAFREADATTSRVVQLGKPDGKRFEYPVSRRRTKENTEVLRRSEANLDAFWSAVDTELNEKGGDLTGTAVKKLLAQTRILERTPKWQESDKSGKKPSESEQPTLMPLSEVYFQLESRTSKTLSGVEKEVARLKSKTIGTPSIASPNAAAVPEANPNDPQPTFSVDSRALKVFRTLFFTPSRIATPGEVAWNDFVHAMVSTGFRVEKMYGSVWHFTPRNLDVERSINFHEPHQAGKAGKIPFQVARRHGRRLYRAYGWHGGMFVLQEKVAATPAAPVPEP